MAQAAAAITTSLAVTVQIAGKEIDKGEVHDIHVELDLDQPDMVAVTLSNQSTRHSAQVKEGDLLEVKLGLAHTETNEPTTVFQGEVVGLEPIFQVGSDSRVIVRGLNAMHELTRGKRSHTYSKKDDRITDKDIIDQVIARHAGGDCCARFERGVSYGGSDPATLYDHVYQHNQTDLEFLRHRAARIGREVYVEQGESGKPKLCFRKRSKEDSGIKLRFGVSGESTLERFLPRLSTANQVSEVRVHYWDPEKKKEFTWVQKPEGPYLGDRSGTAATEEAHPNVRAVDVDVPVYSQDEAKAIASSILEERLMSFITGDATCKGHPDIKPGIVLGIELDDDRFRGQYYVTAVRHRYVHAGRNAGFHTDFRFQRDAESQGGG